MRTEDLLSDIRRIRLVPRRPAGNDHRGGSYSQTDRDMERFNSTGELAGASRSLAGVPCHLSARLCCGSRPSLDRGNLLNAPERNGSVTTRYSAPSLLRQQSLAVERPPLRNLKSSRPKNLFCILYLRWSSHNKCGGYHSYCHLPAHGDPQ